MVKCGVLFEVWTEFLNIIYMGFRFKWLRRLIRQLLMYTSRELDVNTKLKSANVINV
jgi:hypothetical protein